MSDIILINKRAQEKKTNLHKEYSEAKRQLFLADIAKYKAEDLVYIDERVIDSYLHNPWG